MDKELQFIKTVLDTLEQNRAEVKLTRQEYYLCRFAIKTDTGPIDTAYQIMDDRFMAANGHAKPELKIEDIS